MRTTYGYGRLKLPVPIITIENGGSLSGGNNTYYFWLKARNRAGYNTASDPLSLVIGNGKKIKISAANFASNNYEDWQHFIVLCSLTNDITTARVILKQEIYDSTQINLISITDTYITADITINGAFTVHTFPTTGLVNGLRVLFDVTNKVYEFVVGTNIATNGVTVFDGTGGKWVFVNSNSLYEPNSYCTKELFEVSNNELIQAPLPSVNVNPVPITYYIINNDGIDLTSGQLQLNEYLSDTSLTDNYYVNVIGYLNLTTNVLDTTNIQYVNSTILYPDTIIQLTKSLPVGSAFVVRITPNLLLTNTVNKGTFLTLYPKLTRFSLVNSVDYYATPVDDIASLKALPLSVIKDKQTRYVKTKQLYYAYNADNTTADNGDTVLIPNSNPTTGRWLINQTEIGANSVEPSMLSSNTLALINSGIQTITQILGISTTLTINLDSVNEDYFIIGGQANDGGTTVINVTATLNPNTTKAICIELRQNTGPIQFDNSILFPGGSLPVFSGNGKTDLFVITLIKDSAGLLKKRAFLAQKDIG